MILVLKPGSLNEHDGTIISKCEKILMNLRKSAITGIMFALCFLQAVIAAEATGKAPECTLTTQKDGRSLNLQQFHGKVIYVDFWASWCAPCAKSFLFMNDLNHEFEKKGLQIIAINLDEAGEDAKAFLEQYPADFTIAVDKAEQCAKAFQVKAMPSSYLIDSSGIIRHVHLGFRADETAQLRTLIEQLLAEGSVKKK